MRKNWFTDLDQLSARAKQLLVPDAQTTLSEFVEMRQSAFDILLGWGPAYGDIAAEIKTLEFEPYAPAYLKNRPIMRTTGPMFRAGTYNQEEYSAYLRRVLERFIRLIKAAQRLRQSEADAPPAASTATIRLHVIQRQPPRRRSKARKAARLGAGRTQTAKLSVMDHELYRQIGHEEIETHQNFALWRKFRHIAKALDPNMNYSAFRHRVDRIRKAKELSPSSAL